MKVTLPSESRVAVLGCGAYTAVQGAKDLKGAFDSRATLEKRAAVNTVAIGSLKVVAGVAALYAAARK